MSRAFLCVAWFYLIASPLQGEPHPNIVLLYADDLGYGDISCYGATRIQTPNIDRLAEQGLRFTDAHSAAATCTPSRYALLTGEYAWRKKGTGILRGDAPLIIHPGRTTLASMLRKAGYATGVVGKWHLGLGSGNLDWNGDIKPGPLEIGFDYCFLIPGAGNHVPCVYIENHRVVGLDPEDPIQVSYSKPVGDEPTGKEHPELLKMHPSLGHEDTIINGISRKGYMSGGKAARWVDEDMADVFTAKAVSFIKQNKDKPLFLYFSTHDIHTPRVPNRRFAGKSCMGPRGDVILQFDACVGEILNTLDDLKLAENTLVIMTSDNGPVLDDCYKDEAVEKLGNHKPAGPWRGGKFSIFEGGTRVPLIFRWTGRVKPGVSDTLVCQVDFLASFADLTSQRVVDEDAPDSFNVMPALLGESRIGRDHLVEQASGLALRQAFLKYIAPSKRLARQRKRPMIEWGNSPNPRIYDLANDPGETRNLSTDQPEKTQEMRKFLQELRKSGRSRP